MNICRVFLDVGVDGGGDVHIGLDLGRALDVGVDVGQLI